MNRKARRRHRSRKRQILDVMHLRMFGFNKPNGERYWIWCTAPEDMSDDEAIATQKLHGPFATREAARAHQYKTLADEHQCEVKDGGVWPPAWLEEEKLH